MLTDTGSHAIPQVVNGTFRLQQEWLTTNRLEWDPEVRTPCVLAE